MRFAPRAWLPLASLVALLPITRSASKPATGTTASPIAADARYQVNPIAPAALLPQLNSVRTDGHVTLAAGERGVIARSIDDGVTWHRVTTSIVTPLRGVAVQGATALAVGDGGAILRSSDTGITWQRAESPSHSLLRGVAIAPVASGAQVALAVGADGQILRGEDGGVRWTDVALPGTDRPTLFAVTFVSPTIAVAVGEDGAIFRSTDAGRQWVRLSSPAQAALRAVHFSDAAHGVAVGGDDRRWRAAEVILTSSDSGITWHSHSATHGSRLYGVAGNGPRLVAVGERGLTLRSSDAGVTWRTDTTLRDGWLGAVTASARSAVAVGFQNRGRIARNPDLSDTTKGWQAPRGGANGVTGVVAAIGAPDSMTVVIAAGPKLMRSTDAARSFKAVKADSVGPIIHLRFFDARTAIAVGVSGSVLRTTDGGQSWTKAAQPTRRNLRAVAFADSATAVAVGAFGGDGPALFRSVDGARTWHGIKAPVGAMFGVDFRGRALGLAVGGAGSILRSVDAGATWTRVGDGLTSTVLREVRILDDRTAVVAGDGGVMLRSTDAGMTWEFVRSTTPDHLWAMTFASPTDGIVVGVNGAIQRTTDAGRSWQRIEAGTATQLIAIIPWRNGYLISGPFGTLFHLQVMGDAPVATPAAQPSTNAGAAR